MLQKTRSTQRTQGSGRGRGVRSWAVVLLALVLVMVLSGCKRGGKYQADVAYVAAPQANLRDRVAAVYNKTGTVRNGEKVQILDKAGASSR